MKAFLFPGQGSQARGMGQQLFSQFPEMVQQADSILGYSVEDLCLRDSARQLNQTQYTQPALYVVNALTYWHLLQQEHRPDFVAGHSLGEFNALLAADVFDFETGLRLVQKRGQLMAQAQGGGMAAVIGLEEQKVVDLLAHWKTLTMANFNSPTQLVISGPKEDIQKAKEDFQQAGAKYVSLNVSGAFHSAYMQEAAHEFADFMRSFEFAEPKISIISNVTALPYQAGKSQSHLVEQITNPVRWTESVRYLQNQGVQNFHEVGQGNVLTKLLKSIKSDAPSPSRSSSPSLSPKVLGSSDFCKDYGVNLAYVAGAMYQGIASESMVIRMGKAGLLSFFGTGGLPLKRIEAGIQRIQQELAPGQPYGMNFLANHQNPKQEEQVVALYQRYGIQNIEASAFTQVTPALILHRLHGASWDAQQGWKVPNKIMAKLSRPEVAQAFLSPPPEHLLRKLVERGLIAADLAQHAHQISMADDICVEADSGGHTDQGVAYSILPSIIRVRDELVQKHGYSKSIRVGAAGGLGTPESIAASFLLGADFVLTGSINQCTVEAGTSDAVKDLLARIGVQDTTYAPAGDMFEMGAKVQVLRKGVLFPARANKLYELYRRYPSWEAIDAPSRKQIEEKYFERSIEEVWQETEQYFMRANPQEIEKANKNPKHKMALLFRAYFHQTTHWALAGKAGKVMNYQIHCGPALGTFNRWMAGSSWEDWHNRHVDQIAMRLMEDTSLVLQKRFQDWMG